MNEYLAEPKVYERRNQTTTINRLSGSTMHNTGSVGVAVLLLKKLQCTVSAQLPANFPVLMECPGQQYCDSA